MNVAAGTKPRKIRREKVRFGQAPRNALPTGPQETLAAGADQGAGATSPGLPAPGAEMALSETQTNMASNADPLAPIVAAHGKTRYSDRAATEAATKAATKAAKVKEKVAVARAPITAEEKAKEQAQDAPLGLGGDTATKKKKKKEKGAPKERIQDQPPAPVGPKPEMTPIPPKSVRDNGEPAALPAGDQAAPASPTPAPAPPQ